MNRTLAIAAILLAIASVAAAADYTLTIAVGESTAIDLAGATAAYAIDPVIADASLARGGIAVIGRSSGSTQVVVVTPAGTRTILVTVRSRAQSPKPGSDAASPQQGTYEVRYASAGQQIQTAVGLIRDENNRREEVQVQTSTSLGERFAGEPASVIRSATYRITTPRRELTFFDSALHHSPLTIDDTIVRGIHLRQDGWRLHAGYTMNASFGSLLLASERDLIVGGGYEFRLSSRSRLMPSVFIYPDQHGSVASLLYDYRRDEILEASAELAYGGALGASGHLVWNGASNRIRADVRYQPRDFVIVGPSKLHGFYSDASWSTTLARRLSIDTAASLNRYELPRFQQRSVTANGEARYAIAKPFAVTAGFSYGSFSGSGLQQDVRSMTIPVGVQLDFGRFGGSLVYRYATNTASNEGGHGVRATMRASLGSFFTSAYYDHQTDAPTLELILRDDPALSLALQQLGISATTPEDIARALRTNAALISLGFIEGATVNLVPARTQAGLETSWIGTGAMRPQLRARLLWNRTEGVSSNVTTSLGTLTWSQRLRGSTDVYAGITVARTQASGADNTSEQRFFEAGIRQRFDSLPNFGGGGGSIYGIVFVDEEMTGEPTGVGAADVEVLLDGTRSARSDAAGKFAFTKVPSGSHRVAANVTGDAYFTTASNVDVRPGQKVAFGIASTPARAVGYVRDESGAPMANVTVTLTRGDRKLQATTRGDGRYSIAAPPGEYELSVATESLPAGVSFDRATVRRVALQRATPVETALAVQINRSIGGRIEGARAGDPVTIPSLGRTTKVDEEGRYLFRSLPPGVVTITARSGGRTLSRDVSLPNDPAAIRDADLGVVSPTIPAPAPVVAADANNGGTYVVQLGAFRNREYAEDLRRQARAAGVDVVIASRAALMVVQTPPYESHAAATAEKSRITRAGFDAVVVKP
ncbi:MAG: hypothetical protein QOI24_3664 [Acidobacteriota bacterium]|nr:hypothetical protein [Acidobacteriota bacterium]